MIMRMINFNPRTREGCDRQADTFAGNILMPAKISIHAPARGATYLTLDIDKIASLISIHAPARGATRSYYEIIYDKPRDFNPRTREGCDGIIYQHNQLLFISIHAPARGATV